MRGLKSDRLCDLGRIEILLNNQEKGSVKVEIRGWSCSSGSIHRRKKKRPFQAMTSGHFNDDSMLLKCTAVVVP